MRRVAVHQPNYLPWLGFWCKLARVDTFVLYDTCPFSRGGYTARAPVRGAPAGYLSLPVRRAPVGTPISDLVLADEYAPGKHRATIAQTFARRRYVGEVLEVFDGAVGELRPAGGTRVARLNGVLIRKFAALLTPATEVTAASQLVPYEPGVAGIRLLLEALDADHYVSGLGARKYLPAEGGLGLPITYLDGRAAARELGAPEAELGDSLVGWLAAVGSTEARRRLGTCGSDVDLPKGVPDSGR